MNLMDSISACAWLWKMDWREILEREEEKHFYRAGKSGKFFTIMKLSKFSFPSSLGS